jgi:hypothetical protein
MNTPKQIMEEAEEKAERLEKGRGSCKPLKSSWNSEGPGRCG